MARSGLKLLVVHPDSIIENGFFPVPLASMIVRTSTFQATASLLSRPSLRATFVANSQSTNSNPRLARLPHPAASSTTISAPLAPAPLGNTPLPTLVLWAEHSLTPSSRRSTPTRPNFHSLVSKGDSTQLTNTLVVSKAFFHYGIHY